MDKSLYRKKYEVIKPYVNIKYRRKLSPAEKGSITRYYNALSEYGVIGRIDPTIFIFKTKSRRILQAANNASGQGKGLPKLKVAIFRNVPEGAEIVAQKQGKKINFVREGKFLSEVRYLFKDYEKYPGEFVLDPDRVIKRIIPLTKGAKETRFITGEHLEVTGSRTGAEEILYAARNWQQRYGDETRAPGQQWHDFMLGIVAVFTKNQKPLGGGNDVHSLKKASPGKNSAKIQRAEQARKNFQRKIKQKKKNRHT